jgi:dUTP pyrophosphatase
MYTNKGRETVPILLKELGEMFKEMNQYNEEQKERLEQAIFGHTSDMTRYLEAVEGKIMVDYWAYEEAVAQGTVEELFGADVVIVPTYMTPKAVGADCFASEEVVIAPGQIKSVPTGIKAKFNGEEEGLFPFIRSSIPKKKGLFLANGVGVVESDYYGNEDNDGDIGFMFYNYTKEDVYINRFERLGQIVLLPILRFENAGRAGMERGASGSTNK